MRGFCATALALALAVVIPQGADAWVSPVIAKGNRYFYQDSGLEFRIKGMAYYPRPNDGEFADVTNYDWAADDHEDVWGPHLEVMKDLGVNTIRLYSVDPSRSHDNFMCACSNAGIYVLVGMAAPCENCAIQDLEPPACYPDELFSRIQMVYNAFAVYDNTLGFSIGNENNLQRTYSDGGTQTAPCVKALMRDTRNYAASCATSLRQVPIGIDNADILPRETFLSYYDCSIDDNEFTRAEWLGFNPYVECDPVKHTTYKDSTGLQALMKEYEAAKYPRPLMFGEFGCNLGENTVDGYENQRTFYDAKWMNTESDMMAQMVGGNVFEFSTEIANTIAKKLTKEADAGRYGIGYFSPDTCDNVNTSCEYKEYPEYANLKKAYTTTANSTLSYDSFTVTRTNVLECPSNVSTTLRDMPDVEVLECSALQPTCNGKKSNAHTKPKTSAPLGATAAPSNLASSTTGTTTGSGSAGTESSAAVSLQTATVFSVVSMAVAALMV